MTEQDDAETYDDLSDDDRIEALERDLARAERQRDELLAALREAVIHLRDWKEPGAGRLMRWGKLIDSIASMTAPTSDGGRR